MKTRSLFKKLTLVIALSITSMSFANKYDYNINSDLNVMYFPVNDSFSFSINKDDWVRDPINNDYNYSSQNLSLRNNTNTGLTDLGYLDSNQLSMAWDLSRFLSVNVNVFENNLNANYLNNANFINPSFYNRNYSKFSEARNISPNDSIHGYKLGLSSEFNLWNNYKLGMNVDYGQLEGANLIGFRNQDIATTSFGLGLRNSNFGASFNTDIYLENRLNLMQDYRVGFELFWYFSDSSSLSVGTKQRISNYEIKEQPSTLDDLTGNIQYIKFQSNL